MDVMWQISSSKRSCDFMECWGLFWPLYEVFFFLFRANIMKVIRDVTKIFKHLPSSNRRTNKGDKQDFQKYCKKYCWANERMEFNFSTSGFWIVHLTIPSTEQQESHYSKLCKDGILSMYWLAWTYLVQMLVWKPSQIISNKSLSEQDKGLNQSFWRKPLIYEKERRY